MLRTLALSAFAVLATAPRPASADETFSGIFAHGVDTPFSVSTGEGGSDLQLGYRFRPAEELSIIGKPSPYVVASLNNNHGTSFYGAGLSWKLSKGSVYVRPEMGIAVHDGPSRKVAANGQFLHLGSRVLLQPGVSIGAHLSKRLSVEASWVHLSHGYICDRKQNPGLDMIGMRLNLR